MGWRDIPTPVLFHATDLHNLKSIQRTGLCPSSVTQIATWSASDPQAIYVETSPAQTFHWAGLPALLAILKADVPRQCKAFLDWMLWVYDKPEEIAERGQAYALTDCGCIPPDRLWILTSELGARRIKYRFKHLGDVVVPSFPTIGEDYDHSVFVSSEDALAVDAIVKPFIRNYPHRPRVRWLAELFGVSESEMTNMLERVTLYARKQVV